MTQQSGEKNPQQYGNKMKRKPIAQERKELARFHRFRIVSLFIIWALIIINGYNLYSFFDAEPMEVTITISSGKSYNPEEALYSSSFGKINISSDNESLILEIKEILRMMGIDGTGEYENLTKVTYWIDYDCLGSHWGGEIEISRCNETQSVRNFDVSKEDWTEFVLAHEIGHYLLDSRYSANLNEIVADEFAHRTTGKGKRIGSEKLEVDLLK